MLAVQVELLTGRYVATRYNDRTNVEWPPHPARLFSAAVAAWADAEDERGEDEREVLLWWEALGAPDITCSWGEHGPPGGRNPVIHYVADNDPQVARRDTSSVYLQLREAVDGRSAAAGSDTKVIAKADKLLSKMREKALTASKAAGEGSAPASAAEVLPEMRGRKARLYPSISPESARVVYSWPDVDAAAPQAAVLDRVLSRIARLGHSSSMVSVSVTDEAPPPTLRPHERGDQPVRVTSAGQLDALERAFASHAGSDPRTLPAVVEPYRHVNQGDRPEPHRSVLGDDWVLLDLKGSRFDLRDSLVLARSIRKALMSHSPVQPAPPVLSGHEPALNGGSPPLQGPHLAVVALPFVGHDRADGRVSAVALVIPRKAEISERSAVFGALNRWLDAGGELRLGSAGVTRVTQLAVDSAPWSSSPSRWCAPSRMWVSATPMALDRFPGGGQAGDSSAHEIVAASCEHVGLPRPLRIWLESSPPIRGSRVARRFPPLTTQQGRQRRILTHARIEFDQPAAGPVLLGAGRYFGYGLFAPVRERGEA